MMMKLYVTEASPPARAARMAVRALGLDDKITQVEVHLVRGDQFAEDYVKKNPQHTVPMLEEGDFIVCDSHAIAVYLATQHGVTVNERLQLLPSEPQARALMDQRMYFDATIFTKLRTIVVKVLREGAREVDGGLVSEVVENYAFAEAFLLGGPWMTGARLTLADLCLAATISTLDVFVPITPDTFPLLCGWLKRCGELPYFQEINTSGVNVFKQIVLGKMNSN